MLKKEFENKKIAIYGLGLEGKSTINFIKTQIKNYQLYLVDDFINNANDLLDDKTFIANDSCFKDVDLIIKSPGVILKDDFVYFDKLESQTNLFLKYYAKQCIGITGTKGKSTTSSLIYHLIKACDENVFLVGNIGKPVFDCIINVNEHSLFIYELSCHQLEYVKYSPHISIFLNCYQEHLDRYHNFDNYLKAKNNIYNYQRKGDKLYINAELNNENIKANKIIIDCDVIFSNKKIRYKNYFIDLSNTVINLLGEHNFFNIAVAYAVFKDLGYDDIFFKKSLENFKPLKHRLEFIGLFKELKFYNDSISTSCESTISAIKAIKDVDTILLGGLDRGIDYTILLDYLKESCVNNIIFMYASGNRMYQNFKNSNKNIYLVKDLKEAVELSFKVCEKNKSVVLSPASASYDSFKNFEHRGLIFEQLVKKYI